MYTWDFLLCIIKLKANAKLWLLGSWKLAFIIFICIEYDVEKGVYHLFMYD